MKMSKLRYPTAAELLAVDGSEKRPGPAIGLTCWGCQHFKPTVAGDASAGAECHAGDLPKRMKTASTLQECPYLGQPVDLQAV